MKFTTPAILAIALLAAASAAHAATPEVVYENFLTAIFPGSLGGNPVGLTTEGAEIGDEIHLGGTHRRLSQAVIRVYGDPVEAGLVLSLYVNDGPSGKPGTLLHRTDPLMVTMGYAGDNFTFDLPNVLVPDKLTWTLRFDGAAPSYGAVIRNSLHLAGSSPDYGWLYFPDSGFIKNIAAPAWENFISQFSAVPEPNTASLLILGLGATIGMRWRRRACS